MKRLFAALAIVFSASANAQIFKCVAPDGSVAFSQVPCVAAGESQYLGEVQRTTQPESSQDVVQRNLRAAEIMQGGSGSQGAGGPKVTVVRDSSKSPTIGEIMRDRAANPSIQSAPKQTVRTHCTDSGKFTYCYGSDGSRSTTLRSGNNTFTNAQQ